MNNFLSTNPTTLILSSSKWILTKNQNLKKKEIVGLKGREGGGTVSKTANQAVKRGKIQNSNHLHNVKHVVQSTFQNTE